MKRNAIAALSVFLMLILAGLVLSPIAADAQNQAGQRRSGSLLDRQPPPSQGFSLRRLFGIDQPAPQTPSAPPAVQRAQPKPKVAPVRQERHKPQAANRVVVFGDWLADAMTQGLDDIFAEMPNVAIIRRTRTELGFTRGDNDAWAKLADEYLKSKQKVTIAVIHAGMSDYDEAIAEGSERHSPLSDGWKRLYAERVDTVLGMFTSRGIPVVWVGLPPVSNEGVFEANSVINSVLQERVRQAGGIYVDIWPGFVDEDNHYIQTGPDAGGEPTRLRLNDGMKFTRKGADKIAHYAAIEIRRLLDANSGPADVSTSLPGRTGADPFIEIDKTVLPNTPLTSEAGSVQPLTRTESSPGGILLKGKTGLDAIPAVKKALREGEPSIPVRGRMDDNLLNIR